MSTQELTTTPAEPAAARSARPVKVAMASFIGTAIEWYDFFIFGTAAALVFNTQFFPALSPTAGTLAAFATFGVAFAARPLGGVVFGHFGDRIGRKKMLVVSLLIMGVATMAIGLLPTYEQVGIAAPILLVLARLVQGFAVGGEWGGAVLLAVEHAPPGRRAFYGSWPQAGVPAGMVLATAAFFVVGQLPEEEFQAWGWRMPFLASAALLVVGLVIRLQIGESPDFRRAREERSLSAFPLADVLREAKRPLLIGICTQAAAFVPFYLVAVFVLSYGPEQLGISADVILLTIIVAFVLDLVTIPVAAVLADRYGRRRMLLAGSVYMAAIAFPFFWLFDTGSPWLILVAMILAIPIGHAVTYSAVAGYLAELFPAQLRYTGASVAYQIGGALTGGTAPFLAALLFAAVGGSWALALYIIAGCAITFLALLAAGKR